MFIHLLLNILLERSAYDNDDDKYAYLVTYLIETVIKDIQITETLDRDAGLTKSGPIIFAPLQKLLNTLIKTDYRKAHVRHLKRYWSEIDETKLHKERVSYFLDKAMSMYTAIESDRSSSVTTPEHIKCVKELFENLFYLLSKYRSELIKN